MAVPMFGPTGLPIFGAGGLPLICEPGSVCCGPGTINNCVEAVEFFNTLTAAEIVGPLFTAGIGARCVHCASAYAGTIGLIRATATAWPLNATCVNGSGATPDHPFFRYQASTRLCDNQPGTNNTSIDSPGIYVTLACGSNAVQVLCTVVVRFGAAQPNCNFAIWERQIPLPATPDEIAGGLLLRVQGEFSACTASPEIGYGLI